ncbi:MAG: hypothetical protein RSG92_24400 [Pseudomonas sp.]
MKRLAESPESHSFAQNLYDQLKESPSPRLKGPLDRDKSRSTTDTQTMNDITREELNALLENHQLKADARLKEFEGKVADGLVKMDHSLQLLDRDLAGVRGLKGTIILNSVLSVIAIVGITIAVMAYGVANFDSGRDTSAALQEMKQQSFETRQLLEQVKAQQKLLPSTPTPQP